MATPPVCLRLSMRLRQLINAKRGEHSFSRWLRDAAIQRLEREQNIDTDLINTLAETVKQLRGLGINLNQLAHAANEGRPVTVNTKLLLDIDARIRLARSLLTQIHERLPD